MVGKWLVLITLVFIVGSPAGFAQGEVSPVVEETQEFAAAGSWVFTGCYRDGYDCRIQFRNGRYCQDNYLGRNWECLSQERTAPRACYCWAE